MILLVIPHLQYIYIFIYSLISHVYFQSDCFYNAGWTEDIRVVVHYLHKEYPKAPLFAVGTSIGANILVGFNSNPIVILHWTLPRLGHNIDDKLMLVIFLGQNKYLSFSSFYCAKPHLQVKYLGEDVDNVPVAGAVAICSPWDLLVSAWTFIYKFHFQL